MGPTHRLLALAFGLVGLTAITLFAGWLRTRLSIALPAPVLGFVMLALGIAALQRFASATGERTVAGLQPCVRLLLAHMGLLFVPAGAGLITQGDVLRSQWLPLTVALFVSTALGLIVTAAVTQRLLPK